MRRDALSLQAIADVAELLGELRNEVVFVGGAVVPSLITDSAAAPDRPTNDVDIVVEATTPAAYYELSDSLRARGFSEDRRDDPPIICRWKNGNYRVDVMPVDGTFMGFRGEWLRAVCDRPWPVELRPGVVVRLVRAPEFLAAKVEAFGDRGRGDFEASRDLEDILTVIDGRAELLDELREAPDDVRRFVSLTIARWLANRDFLDALPGHLAGDNARLSILAERLELIASLSG